MGSLSVEILEDTEMSTFSHFSAWMRNHTNIPNLVCVLYVLNSFHALIVDALFPYDARQLADFPM